MSCGINLEAIWQQMLKISIFDLNMKIINLRLQPYVTGAKSFIELHQYINWLNFTDLSSLCLHVLWTPPVPDHQQTQYWLYPEWLYPKSVPENGFMASDILVNIGSDNNLEP